MPTFSKMANSLAKWKKNHLEKKNWDFFAILEKYIAILEKYFAILEMCFPKWNHIFQNGRIFSNLEKYIFSK
jgi:hypothetical protein